MTWADAFSVACLAVAKGLQTHQNFARQRAEANEATQKQVVIYEHQEPAYRAGHDKIELADEPGDGSEPEDNIPIDFEMFRAARNEQRRQAESDDFGGPEERVERIQRRDRRGRIKDRDLMVVKPKFAPDPLDDLLEYGKIKKRERETREARQRQAPTAASPKSDFMERFDQRKPAAPTTARTKTLGERITEWFGTPSKPVWK